MRVLFRDEKLECFVITNVIKCLLPCLREKKTPLATFAELKVRKGKSERALRILIERTWQMPFRFSPSVAVVLIIIEPCS